MTDSQVRGGEWSASRAIALLDQPWALPILRQASQGVKCFDAFREALELIPEVLAEGLDTMVRAGLLSRVDCCRETVRYDLTEAGRDLNLLVGALEQWGEAHLPWPYGSKAVRRSRASGDMVHVGYVGEDGREVTLDEMRGRRTGE